MSKDDKSRKATEGLLRSNFTQELGQKAIVEHHVLDEEEKRYAAELREVLAAMAADLQRVKIVNPGFDYLGSFSVHVFASEIMRAFEFMSITNPHKATHPVADAALRKLTQDVNEHFTGKRQRLRSGF